MYIKSPRFCKKRDPCITYSHTHTHIHAHKVIIEKDVWLQGGELWVWNRRCTCDQFSDFDISGLPQKADQGGNTAAVLQGHFVLIVGLAVYQVPQGTAGAAVDLAHPVVQQVDQQLDAPLSADLKVKKLCQI